MRRILGLAFVTCAACCFFGASGSNAHVTRHLSISGRQGPGPQLPDCNASDYQNLPCQPNPNIPNAVCNPNSNKYNLAYDSGLWWDELAFDDQIVCTANQCENLSILEWQGSAPTACKARAKP